MADFEDIDWARAYYMEDEGGAGEDALPEINRHRGSSAAAGASKAAGMSARRSAAQDDRDAWERNRMATSGVSGPAAVSRDADAELQERQQVLVRNLQPPFLRGELGGIRMESEEAAVVRDPTSDMAKMARQGSAALVAARREREKFKMRQRFWELGNSQVGKVMGVEATEEPSSDALGEAGSTGARTFREAMARVEPAPSAAPSAAEAAWTERMALRTVRESLPVFHVRDALLRLIAQHQVVIIVGATGSGKTTQLTQYLHEAGYSRRGMIACTQPRRVAAMSVAARVAQERGSELGGEVGYTIRFEDVTSEATRIKYMTDGVLLRESLRDGDLDNYSAVIMDEAHERGLNTDVLFGVLRNVLPRRADLKLIVTSATMEKSKFSGFFGGAPTFEIPGRTFPVVKHYLRSVPDDYVAAAVRQVLTIHQGFPAGDILVFMTGQEDITATCMLLAERVEALGNKVPPLLVLPMFSQLPADLQARIFQDAPAGTRKCIVSTNIAETSLTVDGIIYVVDPGFCKLKVYNPRIGMDSLRVTPVSLANADQRAGRAGRTAPGQCFRLYTERAAMQELLPATVPEIQRTNLGNVVLLLKSLGVSDVTKFGFMDPPPAAAVRSAMYHLWVLGALDNAGDLTQLGAAMVDFPLDPPLSKMLLIGHELGCSDEVLSIVSMLSVPDVFYRPKDRAEESDAAREKLMVPESDHLTLLNVFQQWLANGKSTAWAERHFIHAKALRKAAEVREQLLDIMGKQRMQPRSCRTDWDMVRRAVCSAYFMHAAKQKSLDEFTNLLIGTPAVLHPSSSLYGLGYTPDYVVYHELVLTTKEYMQCVTGVEAEWLAEMGPMFFELKRKGAALLDQRDREKAAQAELDAAAAAVAESRAPGPASTPGSSASQSSRLLTTPIWNAARRGSGSSSRLVSSVRRKTYL